MTSFFSAQKGLSRLGVLTEGGYQLLFLLRFDPFCIVGFRYPKPEGELPLVIAMKRDIKTCRTIIQSCTKHKRIKEDQNNGWVRYSGFGTLSEPKPKCIIILAEVLSHKEGKGSSSPDTPACHFVSQRASIAWVLEQHVH